MPLGYFFPRGWNWCSQAYRWTQSLIWEKERSEEIWQSTEVKESCGVDGYESVSSNCEVEQLVKQKLCSRRELHLVPHCDTSVSGSNRVSVHPCASGTGTLLHQHCTAAFGLHWEQWSTRSVAWSCFPSGSNHLSGTAQTPFVSVQSRQPIHLWWTWHIKMSVVRKGDLLQEGFHTWCLSYISSWPDEQMPGLVLWSHIRILWWGDKGK